MKIVLDAGHGMNTPGKRCLKSLDTNETREWFLNQRIVSKVENNLKEYEVEVLRVDDVTGVVDVPLADRTRKANAWGADIYCSFHHDAGANGSSAGGISIFTYRDSEREISLRDTLYECLRSAGGLGGRSNPKKAYPQLYVLNQTKMTAVLVEHGFMDSTKDTSIILTDGYAEKMACGWIEFFEKFLGIKKKELAPPIQKGDFSVMTDIQKELFVKNVLYIGLLDREADEGGLKHWVEKLTDYASIIDISNQFMESEEYRRRTVKVAYNRLLDREPDSEGFEHWVEWLAGEKTADDLYKTIMESEEYKAKNK